MDRSVDSIGTCSLDVDASANLSDWTENSSLGTLRSVSLLSSSPQEARLPSYLSLACTVNGYSTTTNYDPERLARSRDASPHRPPEYAQDNLTYSIQNNLLSPPNLVPLPMQKYNMAEQTITHHHQEFYTAKTMTYINKDSRNFSSSLFSKDAVDSCLDSKFRNGVQNKQYNSYESKTLSNNKYVESIEEFKNGESKSFIQQRVERLYGPGALAQGFFVMKRQKNRSFCDSDKSYLKVEDDKHSKSMSDNLLNDDFSEANMKQSSSSPSLPVLRHLTPEFRAQLPIFNPRKGDSSLQKSCTVPVLKDEVNSHVPIENNNVKIALNGCNGNSCSVDLDSDIKDGNYFLKILEVETERLLVLAEKAERELSLGEYLSEDTKGFLRSASGKARLLVSQKMQQFKGLCTNNITQVEGQAFPTTNEDLQGFWDMVMLQVEQVDQLFKEMDILKANNWVEVKKSVDVVDRSINNGKFPRKPLLNHPRAQSAGAEEARKKREAMRKQMLEERRKAMREKKTVTRQNIEIYVPDSS